MGNIRELQKDLFQTVGRKLKEYGFTTTGNSGIFWRTTDFGRQTISLAPINHPPTDFDVTVQLAIRFDRLEDLLNEQELNLTRAEKRDTHSLGVELGNLSEGRQRRWTVSGFDDIVPVAVSLGDSLRNWGLPYLDKYSDMETALEVLSRDDKTARLQSPFHDYRAKKAIGLAFLLGPRDRFLRLAVAKTEFLTARKDSGLASFLRLKETLEQRLKNIASSNTETSTV